jgi:hypothetical protein
MALVVAMLSSPPALGREDLIAAISSIFMDGTRARP